MMSCDIIQILSQTIPDAIPTFSQISIWLCYIWLLYDSYACCYHSIFPEPFHFLSLCYCCILLVWCLCLALCHDDVFILPGLTLACCCSLLLFVTVVHVSVDECLSFFILHSSFSIHLIRLCLYNLISVSFIRLDYNNALPTVSMAAHFVTKA